MVDGTKITSLHLAVLIGFYRFGDLPGQAWLLIPIGYAVVANVMFFGLTLIDRLRRHYLDPANPVLPRKPTLFRSIAVLPTDYGLLCLSFVLFGWREGFEVVYALFFVANTFFLTLAVGKWYRETRRPRRCGTRGSAVNTISGGKRTVRVRARRCQAVSAAVLLAVALVSTSACTACTTDPPVAAGGAVVTASSSFQSSASGMPQSSAGGGCRVERVSEVTESSAAARCPVERVSDAGSHHSPGGDHAGPGTSIGRHQFHRVRGADDNVACCPL